VSTTGKTCSDCEDRNREPAHLLDIVHMYRCFLRSAMRSWLNSTFLNIVHIYRGFLPQD